MRIRFVPALYSSSRENTPIDMLVMHYTAGPSVDDCIDIFHDPERSVSCHYVVGVDGDLVQMVLDHDCAWHCGVSSWGGRDRCNPRALGIEIVNWGRLEKRDDTFFCWPDDYTAEYEGPLPEFCDGYWWPPYPDTQIDAVIELSRHLIAAHRIPLENVVGHSDIAPGRKIDPGPLFPWPFIRKQLSEDSPRM